MIRLAMHIQGIFEEKFIIIRDGLKAVLSRQRRGKAAMSLTDRGRELEAEARQTKFKARPRRGE